MTDSVIYDRGYRPFEGELGGRRAARRAIVVDGVRRILGLRRKPGRKILPWGLLTIEVAITAVIVGQYLVLSRFGPIEEGMLPGYADLFDMVSVVALLFLAVTIPEILGPDRVHGVHSVYFSRPLTVGDYLTGKTAAYLLAASTIYLVPEFSLHLGLAAVSPDGFGAYLGGHLDILWKVPLTALAYILTYGSVLAVIGSYIDRTPFAAATFLGVNTVFTGIIGQLDLPGAKWLAFLAFGDHPGAVRDWVFGLGLGAGALGGKGFDPWVAAVTIVVMTLVAGFVTYRRHARLA